MIDCPDCDGQGYWRPTYDTAATCKDCDGSGQVRGLCNECGDPLRDCDTGDNCRGCVRDFECGKLDTRPQERVKQARKRFYKAIFKGQAIKAAHRWAWRRAWDQAAVRS